MALSIAAPKVYFFSVAKNRVNRSYMEGSINGLVPPSI